MRYRFDWLHGGVEIEPTKIEMNGYAGAPVKNDLSPGGFYVELVLTFGSPQKVKVGVRVEHTSQPDDITDVDSVKEWAIAQLIAQFGQE